jgi:hypothetical protein
MICLANLPVEDLPGAEEHLWRAVIASTIREWTSGPLRLKREAEEYLFGNDTDFAVVCQSAGIDAGRLRAQLVRLRRQGLPSESPALA